MLPLVFHVATTSIESADEASRCHVLQHNYANGEQEDAKNAGACVAMQWTLHLKKKKSIHQD